MKPNQRARTFLAITRSKAKMFEYFVPEDDHITLNIDPNQLFDITIGILGKLSAGYNRNALDAIPLVENLPELQFSAQFFDAYLQAHLDENLNSYLRLLASTAYYLSGLPGSSKVLAEKLDVATLNLEGNGIEKLLVWLLQGNLSRLTTEYESPYQESLRSISQKLAGFDLFGRLDNELFNTLTNLRGEIYELGSPREILLIDSLSAVIRKKYLNSVWRSLPTYSDISRVEWSETLSKETFVKELWPAQHLLGQNGLFRGESAVIQMPTSAGKTKSTEFLIRSAFLSGRTNLAVIVAPFRALCNEIKESLSVAFSGEEVTVNELSDVLQTDFDLSFFFEGKSIIVVTPEKLLYILRQNSEIATSIGLLVLDEGHQFDNGIRGVTYELLVATLLSLIPQMAQKVLISAVISNADVVGNWLNGANSKQVSGANLEPTLRSIGFFSWGLSDNKGQIQYVSNNDIEQEEFFVPKVLETVVLNKRGKETKQRIFPEKMDSNAIALSLGLKLVPNGSVAIFCGRKDSANSICQKVIDLFDRETSLNWPNQLSDVSEIEKLHYLYSLNLGSNSLSSRCAEIGVFSHHTAIPHGLRLSVEYGMRTGLIRFVICTSTLAQGVNLPLKYLIVTGNYQGKEKIKTRDFHNLMGRAGRSGMYTEGSVLFANSLVYDRRRVRGESWRWNQVKELLEPNNSEPCVSNLLSLFDPLISDDGSVSVKMKPLTFVNSYIQAPDSIKTISQRISSRFSHRGFTKDAVERQVIWKMGIISAVESFLMSSWEEDETEMSEFKVDTLVQSTLAYYMADPATREKISELFRLLSKNISEKIAESGTRKVYGKTMYGMKDAQEIDKWVTENSFSIFIAHDDLLEVVWPILSRFVRSHAFQKCDNPEILLEIAKMWVSGDSFSSILEFLNSNNAKLHRGRKKTTFKIEHVIEICEGGLSYDGTLLLSAVTEFFALHEDSELSEAPIQLLQSMQKKMKYGLPSKEAVLLYELGFADRIVAQELALHMEGIASSQEAKGAIGANLPSVREILEKYPSYFQNVLDSLLV